MAGLAVSPDIPFYLLVGWEGKGVALPPLVRLLSGLLPTLGEGLETTSCSGTNYPLFSPSQGLRMVPIRDWMGTRIAISRTSWVVSPRGQSQPFWLTYSFPTSL